MQMSYLMTLRISIIFIALFISSCYSHKDYTLTSKERNFLNAFKAGDTIYYESMNKERDSIVILGIDSSQKEESGWLTAKSAYNTQWVSIQHPLTWNSIN